MRTMTVTEVSLPDWVVVGTAVLQGSCLSGLGTVILEVF